MGKLKVAIIGLDTSHSVEFPRFMNDPECPEELRVHNTTAVSCLRFPTPFQSEEGQSGRQEKLEGWGIKVTTDFDEAVADCDAIMIEINDPAYHLEYFMKCAGLGKPIFLDKPLADSLENGNKICEEARRRGVRFFSASSLRFSPEFLEAVEKMPDPRHVWTYGHMGKAHAGSSIIWYGVHAFEMLERSFGIGAVTVQTVPTGTGAVCVVEYGDGRRGVVELNEDGKIYGGCLSVESSAVHYSVDSKKYYISEVREIEKFFLGGDPPCAPEDALEVMAMLCAADRSFTTGKREDI